MIFYLKCSSGGQSITLVIPINGLTPVDPSTSVINWVLYFIIGISSALEPSVVFNKITGLLSYSKLLSVGSCAPIIEPFGVIVKDPVTPEPTTVKVSPLVNPIPGEDTWILVIIPDISVPTPTFKSILLSPPQYPDPCFVTTILSTAPSLTITSPLAPSPCPLLSKIVILVELSYPLPPSKISTENIFLSLPTIGLTTAPVPTPLILLQFS